MQTQANPYELPNLPTAPTFDNIMATIRSIGLLPNMSGAPLDEIRGLLGQGGPAMAPGLAALQDLTAQNVAGAQSNAMARGLTGSSIEAASMGQARAGGAQAMAQFQAQGAQALADLIFRANAGDREAATLLRTMLAQAMGQELGAQRDISQFNRMLDFSADQAAKNRKNELWAAGIGAAGRIGGGAAAAGAFSDRRLKVSVRKIDSTAGIDIIRFKWGKRAAAVGLKPGKESVGVVAQQVREVYPGAVGKRDGYLTVNYEALPFEVVAAVAAAGR